MPRLLLFAKHVCAALLLFWCPAGRTSRQAYADFLFFSFFAAVGLALLAGMAHKNADLRPWVNAGIAWGLLSLYMCAVRRGHDLGYSGWYTLAHFWRFSKYPYQVLAGEEGQERPNRYGPAPRA